MQHSFTAPRSSRYAATRGGALLALGVALASPGLATPIVYRATVFTDVKLAGVLYHNAELALEFKGDTSNIVPATGAGGVVISPNIFLISQGTASLTLTSKGKAISATFSPGQIIVSVDGDNGGIGFGSLIGPNGFEPAYPLAFVDYTAGDFAYNSPTLAVPAELSGKAWSCIGFPIAAGTAAGCTPPDTYPLKTSLGALVVYNPYLRTNAEGTLQDAADQLYGYFGDYEGSINRGTFSIAPK